jgi:hypothetical protein
MTMFNVSTTTMEDNVMKKDTKQLSLCVVLMVVTIVAFGGCGGDGPTGPKNLDVAGTWLFSGRLSENSCLVLQDEPGFQIGVSVTEIIDVTQNEMNLTASTRGGNIFGSDHVFSGTVNGNSFTLTMLDPLVSTGGRCTFSIGGGMEVNEIKDNSGTGLVRMTTSHQAGNCDVLGPLPCSIVYTGSWRRTSSPKQKSQEPADATSGVSRLQERIRQHLN